MSVLMKLVRPLAGLFVDDGSLALAIIGIVALAAILSYVMPNAPLAAGGVLLFGCLGTLLANVLHAEKKRRP